ncbi:MAG: vanadium-dependent haloperoxidase [Tabrizicola sp.]|nr:vanadium-dependent haloperoxidase [Tabrizicola sp.]
MEPLHLNRRSLLLASAALILPLPALAQERPGPEEVVLTWYRLILELIRHTATYSPPVASRAFAYLGVSLYEAIAGPRGLTSLAGQVNGLTPLPPAPVIDEAVLAHEVLAQATAVLFGNTGPTGQRAITAMTKKLGARVTEGVDPALAQTSSDHAAAVVAHILAWAETDGGAKVENLGFPMEWTLGSKPSSWVPTNTADLQQAPLLPYWGTIRPFALTGDLPCGLEPPPEYSEDPASAFYAEAMEVYETSKTLTDEQKIIARFWSDDPMLSPTPPGHWASILIEIAARDALPIDRLADALARLGMAVADAFIVCWRVKFEYDLIRPVTYIRRLIDPKWEPLLITPPFPEYPSGHSTQSGAAYAALEAIFGPNFAFGDATHEDDGLPVRSFPSFKAAAEEAAISRLYGGIHFRAAIEKGIAQGECVAAFVNRLKTL